MSVTPNNLPLEPPMWFCTRFLTVVVFWNLISAWGSSAAVVGKLRGSVELPCELKPLTKPIKQIMVYWQQKHPERDLVVATAINGNVDMTSQNGKYKGRAHLAHQGLKDGNFTLHLSNLSLEDTGSYICIVLWDLLVTNVLYKATVHLEVTAEFSTPVVENSMSGQVGYGEERNLTCTTQGGTRQPRIMWINSSDGTALEEGRIHYDVQRAGDLINVTSTITINVTSSINVSCIVLTEYGNRTSQSYTMEVTNVNLLDQKPDGVPTSLPIVIVFLLLIILVSGTILITRRFLSSQSTIHYEVSQRDSG